MSNVMGAAAYAKVGVESDVMSAGPHRLIVLLFDGAAKAIRAADLHMQAGRAAAKGEAISRAIDIVNNGLAAALDMERGGEVAEQLHSLYEYVCSRLLSANLHDNRADLAEAGRILEDVASAWREIDPKRGQAEVSEKRGEKHVVR
ncbi:MAG TPA: flagellar export chaperone FliS [Oleiagrimonas sp.]|nr:flagellar export chaperone FliS [Oleiagrimonas sp.]